MQQWSSQRPVTDRYDLRLQRRWRTFLTILISVAMTNIGIAEWNRHTIDGSSRGADGVRVADINGDGLSDFVTGWEEGGSVRVCLHPGIDRVKQAWPGQTVGRVRSPEDAVFADLDGNGQMDVVSCCEGKTRSVFFHWAPRSGPPAMDWETAAVPALQGRAQWMYAAPVDIDGQSVTDLVIGAKGARAELGWLQSPAQPRHLSDWKWHPLQQVGWIMSIIPVDMDQDGDTDILYSDRKGRSRGIYWLEHPGREQAVQQWQRHPVGGTDREVMFLTLADLDNDGQVDVLATVRNGPISWYRRRSSSGTQWELTEIDMPTNTGTGKGIAVFDVDLDGQLDIVFTCENALNKHGAGWISWPDREFHSISGEDEGVKFDLIQALDLDGDGDLDLVTCEERDNLGLIWYENPARSK